MKCLNLRTLLLSVAVLSAFACGHPPATRYYLLESPAVTAERASSRPEGLRIGVEPFLVDAPYDQDRIAYRVGKDSPEIAFYEYHRWAAPVSRMLARFVAASLEGAPGIASIEPLETGAEVDLLLRGHMRVLEEVDLPSGQSARIDLELRLFNLAGEEIWSDRLIARTEVDAKDVADIVRALTEALSRALAQRQEIPLPADLPN